MRYTLLEIVQRILASMDSDEVDSITDTAEAVQVGLLVEGCYYDLISEANIPPMATFFSLTAGGVSYPTKMTVPNEVMSMEWVKYDKQESGDTYEDWDEITFMPTEKFMEMINGFRTYTTGVGSFDETITTGEGTYTVPFMYRTDKQPQYYTTFDDATLIFDSYLASLDTTGLTAAKTQCWGSVVPTFTQEDDFTPDLNALQFSMLMNLCKKRAFEELKQVQNNDAAEHYRRNKIRLRNTKRKVPYEQPHPLARLPQYGRK